MEFNLSDKIMKRNKRCPEGIPGCLVLHQEKSIEIQDVKEFIKKLRLGVKSAAINEGMVFPRGADKIDDIIDKLAGEKLI